MMEDKTFWDWLGRIADSLGTISVLITLVLTILTYLTIRVCLKIRCCRQRQLII